MHDLGIADVADTDRCDCAVSDPKIVHLAGLNLHRAWCMQSVAAALSGDHQLREPLVGFAEDDEFFLMRIGAEDVGK